MTDDIWKRRDFLIEGIESEFKLCEYRNAERLVFTLKEESEDLDRIILVRGFIKAYRNYLHGRDPLAKYFFSKITY